MVTEIPYQVQKSRLIEQIAQLLEEKKLPLLGDVRDESTEIVRLVLDPKSRGVEPEVLMETLFRATAAGDALPAQHERADGGPARPVVLGLKRACCAPGWITATTCWCAAPAIVSPAIERRLEILDGYPDCVYLNLDEVIRIIREEDEREGAG